MKKIIVDTNIIFSCLLNSQGTIGDLIFNSEDIFDFYSNQYMRFEIRKHWNKLIKVSRLTDLELETAYEKMLTKLTFINEELIPQSALLPHLFLQTTKSPPIGGLLVLQRYQNNFIFGASSFNGSFFAVCSFQPPPSALYRLTALTSCARRSVISTCSALNN